MPLPWPSWGEFTTALIALAGGFGWWDRRRGRVATLEAQIRDLEAKLETVQTESAKAIRAHEDATAAKNLEIQEWRHRVERQEDTIERREARIDALEDQLYARGGMP